MPDHAENVYIKIPLQVVEQDHFSSKDLKAVYSEGKITLENVAYQYKNERISLWTFLISAIVSGLIALGLFAYFHLAEVPLTGNNSIAQATLMLGTGLGGLVFFGTALRMRQRHLVQLKWRHLLTLTLAFTLLIFVTLTIFFKIFASAFIGLHLANYIAAFIVALLVGIVAYTMVAAGRNINFSTITIVLIATLFGGILFSMITNNRPDWWQYNFSYLGTQNVSTSLYFNFTLIFSGLIMLTLIDYLFSALHADFHHNRRLFILRVLFSMFALTLAGVGLFPNNPGWTHVVHDQVAQLLVTWVLLMIGGIYWLLPDSSREFLIISYAIGALLIFSDFLFQTWHVLSLTGFEIVACGLVFFWIILLLTHLRNIALPSISLDVKVMMPTES